MTNPLSNSTKPFNTSNKIGGNEGSKNPEQNIGAENFILGRESSNVSKQTRTIGEPNKTTASELNTTLYRINEIERINGVDIAAVYGAYSLNGQMNRVLSFPSLKEPDKTDWFEDDGVEMDLSNPVFDVREFDLHYGVKAQSADAFLEFLNELEGYIPFYFEQLNMPFMLRIVRHRYKYISYDRHMTLFTLSVVENAPLDGYIYKQPSDEVPQEVDIFSWDGRNLAEYGILTLAGGLQLSQIPNRKRGFSSESKYTPGEDYSPCRGGKEAREIEMRLLFRTTSEVDYHRKRDALLYDFSRPGDHQLRDRTTGIVYSCVYTGCESRHVSISEKGIWQLMELKLLLTRGGE